MTMTIAAQHAEQGSASPLKPAWIELSALVFWPAWGSFLHFKKFPVHYTTAGARPPQHQDPDGGTPPVLKPLSNPDDQHEASGARSHRQTHKSSLVTISGAQQYMMIFAICTQEPSAYACTTVSPGTVSQQVDCLPTMAQSALAGMLAG